MNVRLKTSIRHGLSANQICLIKKELRDDAAALGFTGQAWYKAYERQARKYGLRHNQIRQATRSIKGL